MICDFLLFLISLSHISITDSFIIYVTAAATAFAFLCLNQRLWGRGRIIEMKGLWN